MRNTSPLAPLPPLRRLAQLGLVAAAAVALVPSAQATQLVPQNLTQMIAKADVIVTGRVTSVKDGITAEGMPYTEVTLKVSGSVKKSLSTRAPGKMAGKTSADTDYTFRQYGLLKPRRMSDGRYLLPAKIEGMPTWRVGEQVMSFMNKPASRTGLVTPVGLAQGKLTINGTKAANSFNNVGLFDKVQVGTGQLRGAESAMLTQTSGGVEFGLLQSLVQRAVKNNWIANGVMR